MSEGLGFMLQAILVSHNIKTAVVANFMHIKNINVIYDDLPVISVCSCSVLEFACGCSMVLFFELLCCPVVCAIPESG